VFEKQNFQGFVFHEGLETFASLNIFVECVPQPFRLTGLLIDYQLFILRTTT